MTPLRTVLGGVRLTLHVQPRAARTELAGLHGDALKLRLAAPPVDGAANEELVGFLAKQLSLPRRSVRLLSGSSGRRKVIEIMGIDLATAGQRLGLTSSGLDNDPDQQG